jgi:hypothetical protein
MLTNLGECNVSPPLDCDVPTNRLTKIPIARAASDKPTPLTERLLRYELSLKFFDLKKLEAEGSVPKDPSKVQALHEFALDFQKRLPPAYQRDNPDTRWDEECPFLPTHRELLYNILNFFFLSLHRNYLFTREGSQMEVFERALIILGGQAKLFEKLKGVPTRHIVLTFPTFDSGLILSVIMISNPKRYRDVFIKVFQALNAAIDRLTYLGTSMAMAKAGAEILSNLYQRVLAAQEQLGVDLDSIAKETAVVAGEISSSGLSSGTVAFEESSSAGAEGWTFTPNAQTMGWIPEESMPSEFEFGFGNLGMMMPLREFFLTQEEAPLSDSNWSSSRWNQPQQDQAFPVNDSQESSMDTQAAALAFKKFSSWDFGVQHQR